MPEDGRTIAGAWMGGISEDACCHRTRVDQTEQGVVGREAVVPLEPPVGATTRPLDGQNLRLQRTLPGGSTGRKNL